MTTDVLQTTVNDLLETSRDLDSRKADFKAPAREFRFDDLSNLVPSAGGLPVSPLTPTRWAYNQVFAKLGPVVYGTSSNRTLPADYLLALRPEQRAALLNDHLDHAKATWLVRSFDDTARAVLSDKYQPTDNSELLDVIDQIQKGTTQESSLTRDSSVTPDSLNMRIIFKTVETGNDDRGNGSWGIGVAVRNGETGNRRGGIYPLIQRTSCHNSIIVDNAESKFEWLHLGNIDAKRVSIKAALVNILPFAATLIGKLIEADEILIPDLADVIAGICKKNGWSEKVKANVIRGTENRDTLLGIINGVTFAAHDFSDPDEKSDVQAFGGALLTAPDSVFHKFASIGREPVSVRTSVAASADWQALDEL